jgi:hypothetical protein
MNTTPFLTDAEVAEMCAPLKMGAAQCRYLARLGLLVKKKPSGRPLVARSEVERVFGSDRLSTRAQNQPSTCPNVVGLQQWVKGKRHGPQTQGR